MIRWTNEEDEHIRRSAKEGLSASQAGKAIGRNRCQVIGRGHRIGVVFGGQTVPAKKSAVHAIPARLARIPARLARIQQEAAAQTVASGTAIIAPGAVTPQNPIDGQTRPVTLMNLTPYSCRWPVSGSHADTLFCNAPAEDDHPYCAAHLRIAHHGKKAA